MKRRHCELSNDAHSAAVLAWQSQTREALECRRSVNSLAFSPAILHLSSMRLPRRFGADAPTLLAMTDNGMPHHIPYVPQESAKFQKLSPLVREISWSNNLLIINRTKTIEEREFYLRLSIKERLSHRELDRQITAAMFERTMGEKPKLSTVLRELDPNIEKVFKDQYVLEFVGNKTYGNEGELKSALIKNMKQFILELGKDFIFIDEEYRLQVGNSDFRIDLLFFNRELQCLVAFELKMEQFKPEHLGQLDFYLEALDRDVKKPKENPSIGVLLCTDKDNKVVEYALSRSLSPTMVAEYKLHLPDKKLLEQKLAELNEQLTLDPWN